MAKGKSKKKVKTIKGLIGLLKNIARQDIDQLKGYEEMTDEEKQTLSFLMGEANNFIRELGSVGN